MARTTAASNAANVGSPVFLMIECPDPACRFRAPADHVPPACPACGAAPLAVTPIGVPAAESADESSGLGTESLTNRRPGTLSGPASQVVGVLDNVRSALNVGAMFRTADAAGLDHLHLVGLTARPPHATITKTALGAQDSVPWTGHRNGPDLVDHLHAEGWVVWALEAGAEAVSLPTAVAALAGQTGGQARVALVVGHEVAGVDPALLDRADRRVGIPMRGLKGSLNVSTAFGIAAYALTGLA